MPEDLQMILTDMPKNLQMIFNFSSFSPIFSVFLCFSLRISFFLRIFAPENPLPRKGCGVIILKKVLKNDAALPSAMDSRAFLPFYFLPLRDYPSSKSTI